ncbi:MAG TPA: hypothetical protein VFU12_03900 [Glycomyces sp.]|nr:hypothetical protein [Glycomyces sp.]
MGAFSVPAGLLSARAVLDLLDGREAGGAADDGAGTGIEIDLAVTMGKKILPFAASGGVAEHFAMEAADGPSMRGRISEATFLALCRSDADTYPLLVGQLIGAEEGVNS